MPICGFERQLAGEAPFEPIGAEAERRIWMPS
jgi:hypothetical protein